MLSAMSDRTLEAAIGREIRAFRTQLGLTIVELAQAGRPLGGHALEGRARARPRRR